MAKLPLVMACKLENGMVLLFMAPVRWGEPFNTR